MITKITLQQFNDIIKIQNDTELVLFEKYCEIFDYLGIENYDETNETFRNNILEFDKLFDNNHIIDQLTEFELEGYTYRRDKEINIKDLILIEKYAKSKKDYVLAIIAITFKRTDLSKVEHKDNAHIENKIKLFKDLDASVFLNTYIEVVEELNKFLAIK